MGGLLKNHAVRLFPFRFKDRRFRGGEKTCRDQLYWPLRGVTATRKRRMNSFV